MRIYVPTVMEGQEWALPRHPDDNFVLTALGGKAQPGWEALEMEFLTKFENGAIRDYSDFPWCGEHVLILRPRALEALRPAFEDYGEFLPLRCSEPLWLFNVTTVIDALDEERSQIVWFDEGGILDIEKYEFLQDRIGGAEIFKLQERDDGVHVSSIFLQEPMVRRIGALGRKGVAFEMVWSDEAVPDGELRIGYPGERRAPPTSSLRTSIRSFFRR